MTITSTPSEISYAGDGVTVAFPIPFVFDTAADLKVVSTDANGNPSVLTTGFSVSGGNGATGTLTFTSPPSASVDITILDNPEIRQSTDYVSNDPFPAESHERALDRLTRICKRLTKQLSRSLRTQDGDPISDLTLGSVDNRKGKYLFFNAVTGAIEYALSLGTTIISQSIIGQLLNPRTNAEIAAGVVPVDYSVPSHEKCGSFIPDRYGTIDRTGAVSSRAAIQTAITVARAAGGGDVDLRQPGNYLIDGVASSDSKLTGILVPYSADDIEGGGTHKRIRLLCTRETNLLAGSNNMIVIRWSDSLGMLVGFPTIRGNGKTSVWAVGLVPEDMTQTTTCVFQAYNRLEISVRSCAEGIVLVGGPNVAGRDSGCWLNTIEIYAYSCTRGVWLANATTTSSLVNTRNWLKGRVGQVGTNTGCQIDAGSENQIDLHFEGILSGTSPNAVPTAVKIATAPPAGGENTNNKLWGSFEACTRHIDCAQDDTWILTATLDESACVFTQRPKVIITRQTAGVGDSLVEASEVRGAQRMKITGASAPLLLVDGNAAAKTSLIRADGGAGTNFNGVQIASNTKEDDSQGNGALSSWRVDIGGYDATALTGSGDKISFDRKAAAGAWANLMRISNAGALEIKDGITAPGTVTGYASIYIDSADGDLKIRFADGTVKTIVTDT